MTSRIQGPYACVPPSVLENVVPQTTAGGSTSTVDNCPRPCRVSASGQERTSVTDRFLLGPPDASTSLCNVSLEAELWQQAI